MKLNGITIEQHGTGANVAVSVFVGNREEIDQKHIDAIGDLIVRAVEAFTENSDSTALAPASDVEEKPARTRRGRSEPEEEPEEKPARTRRGRSEPEEKPVRGRGDDEITDRDLTKASSEAAQKVGPRPVKKLVSEFNVETVGDIPQKFRREFLDALDELTGA